MKRILLILAVIIVHCTLLIDNCVCQWVQQSVPVTSGFFVDMKFVNQNTGFISHSTYSLLRTTNSGYNWQIYNGLAMRGIATVDSLYIYGAGFRNGNGRLFKSTNAGLTWDSVLIGSDPFTSLYFFNRDTGLISGSDSFDNLIWRTTDGGQTKQLMQTFVGSSAGKVNFIKEKVNGEYYGWYYYTNNNSLFVTTNSGLNWVSKPALPQFVNSIFFINKDTGWASINNLRNYVLYTTNGGNNWNNRSLPYSSTNFDIFFINPQKGWMGCDLSNKIYATTNGGIVWGTQYILGLGSSKLSFIDSMTGWAQSSWNAISLTTNGGGTITSIISGSAETQKDYRLYQNYPNPFNPITNVKFSIARHGGSSTGDVKLVVYDVQGREVQTLVNETLKPGTYETTFDASALPTGIYFYQLIADGIAVQTRKMILLK